MNLKRWIGRLACLGACTLMLPALSVAKTLDIGMTTALTGPAGALGAGMQAGVQAYFDEANAKHLLGDNQLKLIALDDGYNPDKAAPNMRQLITKDNVLAVIGNVGTPTAIVTVPIANELKTLLFGAFTGAGVLRQNPPDRYVINYRASYAQETAAMVNGLLKAGIKPDEIAFFTQNDGYGDAGYKGAIAALKKAGVKNPEILAHGRYERNTTNVEDGLMSLLDAKVPPKAVICVGAYKPIAAFIKLAKQQMQPVPLFLNVSFVGSRALADALGPEAKDVIITQVVPDFNADLPGVKAYREAMKTYQPKAPLGFVSLEGYLAAKIFVAGVAKAGANPTRESIIDGIEGLKNLDIGIGMPISFSKTEHQASHKLWPTIYRDGQFVPFEWSTVGKLVQ